LLTVEPECCATTEFPNSAKQKPGSLNPPGVGPRGSRSYRYRCHSRPGLRLRADRSGAALPGHIIQRASGCAADSAFWTCTLPAWDGDRARIAPSWTPPRGGGGGVSYTSVLPNRFALIRIERGSNFREHRSRGSSQSGLSNPPSRPAGQCSPGGTCFEALWHDA